MYLKAINFDNGLGAAHDIYKHKARAPDSRGETLCLLSKCFGQNKLLDPGGGWGKERFLSMPGSRGERDVT